MNIFKKYKQTLYVRNFAKLKRKQFYYQEINNERKLNLVNDKLEKMSSEMVLLEQSKELERANRVEEIKLKLNEDLKDDVKERFELELKVEEDRQRFMKDDNAHLMLTNLSMQFGGLKAVNRLSFTVKKGEIFGLIGPNGAGKTTVFNCITQFYKPTEGGLYYRDRLHKNHALIDYQTHDVIDLGIVRTFQNVELVWELSVLDNLLVGAHSIYSSGFFTQLLHLPRLKKEEEIIKKKAIEVLTKLKILQYKDVSPWGLPYGILKRIELARTLMTNPSLIILDEPAAGLNETETKELAKLIIEIRNEFDLTIFLVEHDMGLVMDICDQICAISFGQLLAIGTPTEIQKNKAVQEAYLGGE